MFIFMIVSLALLSCRLILANGNTQLHGTHCSIRGCGDKQLESFIPQPPDPEPIDIIELPLPPVVTSDREGSCSFEINPHSTGCINQTTELQSGSFTPDGDHITAVVTFVGAPAEPDPASIYTGSQIILIKADGTVFPNGDSWKCLTCGIAVQGESAWDSSIAYPQAFRDGKRLLAGTNIVSCGEHKLISEECTPSAISVYPIYWRTSSVPMAPSGSMRELRLHPDDVHLAWSSFTFTSGSIGQLCYLGRLKFNPAPISGLPLTPRYDLEHVNLLHSLDNAPPLSFSPNGELTINYSAITVGEVRGFSGSGREITYIGYPHESCNIDVFAIDLHTGSVRRLTSHPDYADPVDISPDDEWTVAMDTRASGRQMFLSGMRHVPPIIDLLVTAIVASTRNNGHRRFFQPWLIDRYGDRGSYIGQQLNAVNDDSPYSRYISDENWNGLADPKFSPDGTKIVYHQALVIPPACGGANPLPCPLSLAPGGRTRRIMLACLTSRTPLPPSKRKIVPAPDVVSWGTRYIPGVETEMLAAASGSTGLQIPVGEYKLCGSLSGLANITVSTPTENAKDQSDGSAVSIGSIAVKYTNFSDYDSDFEADALVLNGYENVTVIVDPHAPTAQHVDWYSDLVQVQTLPSKHGTMSIDRASNNDDAVRKLPQIVLDTDPSEGDQRKSEQRSGDTIVNTKKTGPEGFHLSIDVMRNMFEANGTLTTVVDGVEWRQPENGT